MNRTQEPGACRNLPVGGYDPPAIMTLVSGPNRRYYEWIEEWRPPPGWSDGSPHLDLTLYPSIRPGLHLRRLGSAMAIHDPLSANTHSLNEAAAVILVLCNGLRSVEGVLAQYAEIFCVGRDKAQAEVERVVGELLEKEVLVRREEPSCL